MSTKKDDKLPPDEAWKAVEKTTLSEEAKRVAALSDAALDRELEKAGVDPKGVRARGAALAERLMAQRAEKTETERKAAVEAQERAQAAAQAPAEPSLWAQWRARVGASVAVAAAAVAAIVASTQPATQSVAPQDDAAVLREDAFGACAETQWARCAQLLDRAKAIDPAGESAERVQRARREITAAVHPDGQPSPGRDESPRAP
jgi:hypothetical protein